MDISQLLISFFLRDTIQAIKRIYKKNIFRCDTYRLFSMTTQILNPLQHTEFKTIDGAWVLKIHKIKSYVPNSLRRTSAAKSISFAVLKIWQENRMPLN